MTSTTKKLFPKAKLRNSIYAIALLLSLSATKVATGQISLTASTGTTTGSYTTLNAAFTAINAGTHTGVINISITANTTEPATPVPLLASGTSSSSYTRILIRPSGGNFTINSNSAPSTNRGIIELTGADNVTIDGDDPLTSGVRNLTIQSVTSTTAGIACVRLSSNSTTGTDGANNDTVMNCNLIGARSSATVTTVSYGIQMSNGNSTSSATTGAYSSINTVLMNNNISRVYYGINAIGTSTTYPNTGLRIIGNIIGSSTSADNIGFKGIMVTITATTAGSTSAIVSDNDVRVGDYGTTGYAVTLSGIELGSTNAGCLVTRNNIHDINQPSTGGYGAYGILMNNATNNSGITITNNFIRDCKMYVYSTSIPSTWMPIGVYISSGATNVVFNHNTIVMNDQLATSSIYPSACVIATSATTFSQFLNNILINNHASSGAYCFYTASTTTISAANTNNNNYFVNSSGNIGYYNGANRASLSAWQTATSKDGGSISESTSFTSSTDLHIPAGTISLCESGGVGTATTSVTIDYDKQTRPGTSTYGFGTAPDIGADEFNGQVIYTCSTPAPGATIKSPSTICSGNTLNLSLTTATSGTGVKYQWQSSASSSGPWADIAGQTSATATVTPSAFEFYRCKVKCLAGPDSTYSTATQVAYTNSVASSTPNARCGTGTVNLSATTSGTGTLTWYAAAIGGSSLGTGSPFTTPSISATTNFFVANEAISTGSVTNGTGTTAFSGTGSSPFSQSWESNRSQYLIMASELSALGLVSGNITTLSIPVSSKFSSMAFAGYTIKMGHTTATAMTASTYLSPTFTTVYGPTNYSSTSGANNFTFSSSFNWDGTSNIVIDLCFDNDPTGSGILYTSNDAVTSTTKSYMAVVGMYNDDATLCGATTGGTYVNTTSLPNFSFTGNVGCISPRVSVTATVNTLPLAPAVTSAVSYCLGATASALTATGTSLKWYTVATGGTGSTTAPTPITSATGTTNYYVSQTNATTLCESPRALIAVTVNPLPAAPSVTTPINYCIGSTASALTAPGTNLLWYTTATGGSGVTSAPTPSTASVGTVNYYVSQTDAMTCESSRALIAVITNSILPAPTVTTPVNICLGATTSALTATGTGLTWYATSTGGLGSSSAPTPSSGATGTTNYYVSQSASGACEGPRALIAAQVNPLPVAPTVSTPYTVCQNVTASALTATGTSLLWYTVATSGTGVATAPTPSTTGSGTTPYYVSQTNSFSCEGPRALLNVVVNPAPALPTISTPVVYCQNYSASALTATGTSLKWYTVATGGTGSTTAPTPSTATATSINYYVTQSNTTTLCESQRANIVVTINPTPAAPIITTPVAYCQFATTATALTATGTSLLWYTAASGGTGVTTAPTPSTASTGATNNYVTQTNTFSCESPRANIVVNINPLPLAPTVVSPLNLCIGSSAFPLTATGTSLKWYSVATGGTGSSTAPTPSTTSIGGTDYYVSQTNTFTCEGARSKLTVQVQPLPLVNISSLSPSGFIFCRYKSITLKANAPTATNFQWSYNGSMISTAITDTIIADTTGYFRVNVSDVYGCKNKDSVWAQRDTSVLPTLSPASIQMCENASDLLTTNPGFATWSFNWQLAGTSILPATPASNVRGVSSPGIYRVITTNGIGCFDTTNDAIVSNFAKPTKPIIVNAKPLLSIATIYRYYQWYHNNVAIIGANTANFTVSSNGYYFATVTDENGCLNESDTIQVLLTTNINSISKQELKIYPNPTRSKVQIESPFKVNVRVTDIVGRLVLDAKETKEINLDQFAAGTYLFIISDEQNNIISVEKIHKED